MNKNMSSTDRMIRIVLALVVAVLYWQNIISGTVALVLVAVAIILLLTSTVSFCPLYKIFGLSSRKKEEE